MEVTFSSIFTKKDKYNFIKDIAQNNINCNFVIILKGLG